MPFVRISVAQPRPEARDEVRRYYQDLIESTSRLPGFVTGYVLESSGNAGDVGRVTVWESQEAANHAANDPHVMSIHARLIPADPERLHEWDMNTILVAGPRAAV
jgi:quinol monooxygenase YgiN